MAECEKLDWDATFVSQGRNMVGRLGLRRRGEVRTRVVGFSQGSSSLESSGWS